MWVVVLDINGVGSLVLAVVRIDCIFRAVYLILIFGNLFVSDEITCVNSLNSFKRYYANRLIDHNAFDKTAS